MSWARLTVGVLMLAPAVAVAQPFNVQPSYKCGGELSAIEQAICTTPYLADLDVHLSRQYRYARDELGSRVRDDQRAWVHGRNAACGALVDDALFDCLSKQYNKRLNELSAAVDNPNPAAADWGGDWSNAWADLTIKPGTDTAAISGSAVYITQNVCQYGPNMGSFDATTPEAALAQPRVEAESADGCGLVLRLRGAVLEVEQLESSVCGGLNVTFDGVYTQGGVETTLDCG